MKEDVEAIACSVLDAVADVFSTMLAPYSGSLGIGLLFAFSISIVLSNFVKWHLLKWRWCSLDALKSCSVCQYHLNKQSNSSPDSEYYFSYCLKVHLWYISAPKGHITSDSSTYKALVHGIDELEFIIVLYYVVCFYAFRLFNATYEKCNDNVWEFP